jgi:hypothetical protein
MVCCHRPHTPNQEIQISTKTAAKSQSHISHCEALTCNKLISSGVMGHNGSVVLELKKNAVALDARCQI